MKLRIMIMLIMVLAMTITIAGCLKTIDPADGQVKYAVSPAADKVITTTGVVANTAQQVVTPAIAAINPVAGSIAGLILGVAGSLFGAYKRWRKPLITLSDKYDRVSLGLKAAADVIDNVVKPNAEAWNKAKPILRKAQRNGAVNGDKIQTVK